MVISMPRRWETRSWIGAPNRTAVQIRGDRRHLSRVYPVKHSSVPSAMCTGRLLTDLRSVAGWSVIRAPRTERRYDARMTRFASKVWGMFTLAMAVACGAAPRPLARRL